MLRIFKRGRASRRGAVALTFTIAAIPAIGMVGLGSEAGEWYLTKWHAQNAADAAAYSGAVALALGGNGQTVGTQFAAQDGFCTTGGTGCSAPFAGATQNVNVQAGTCTPSNCTATFVAGSGTVGNAVKAVITQSQPPLLARLFLTANVSMVGQALAVASSTNNGICALGLQPTGDAITIGGGGTLTGGSCALQSDSEVKMDSSPSFSGSGWSVDAVTGCTTSASCAATAVPYNWSTLPVPDPLASSLDPLSFGTASAGKLSCSSTCSPSPAGKAYGDWTVNAGATVTMSPGTYVFNNASIKINGGSVTGTGVNIVLLGTSSLTINGNATVSLTACTTGCTYSALDGVLIDDQSSGAVKINGGSGSGLGGIVYAPNADVTWNGGSVSELNNCTEVVANTLSIQGGGSFGTAGCPPVYVPHTEVVMMAQ